MWAHRADDGACGAYRLRWPVEALQKDGADVWDQYDYRYQAYYQPSPFGDRITGVADDVSADVVVFQRPLTRQVNELMAALRAAGAAIVVETDDDFSALPLRHPIRADLDPIADPHKNWRWQELACERADLVTCSTPALARRYGSHGRVVVLANYVPQRYLALSRTEPRERPWVGWSGSTHTHVGDLRVTKGAIADVLAESSAELHVVGTGDGVGAQLGVGEPMSTGWVGLDEYPQAYAELDVAIAPLKLSAFNQAKSWLKVLEAAALGVACVGSPTAEYEQAASRGLCQLAGTPEDWRREVRLLVADEVRRSDQAAGAREAASRLTIQAHAWRWMEAWSQAVVNRKQRVAA